jgi:ERCC4-type nuclease
MSTIETPSQIKTIVNPFTVVADTREQQVYTFEGLWDGPAGRSKLIVVPTVRATVPVGDYSIEGMLDRIAIERKSKADLYSSVSQARENFVGRLERMAKLDFAAVVVEAEWLELLTDPPRHTKYAPKALSRTIDAWMIRYPVHWVMMPSREHAERKTFRLLERYWRDQQERPRERFHPGLSDIPMSDPDEKN